MKLTKLRFLLLMGMIIAIPFRGHSRETPLEQTITISFENETLKTAIKRIEKETGISFAYSNHKDFAKKVSGTFTNQKLSDVLTSLLKGTSLSFKEIAGKVIQYEVSRKEKKPEKATLHGYVTDSESGERLINANIFDPGTYIGTISNNFGFYSYSAQTGKIQLVFNYMGYQAQSFTIDLKSDTIMDVALRPRIDELGEVTVIGTQSSQVENTQMSMISLPVQKLEKVPVILGEADVLKVIQMLPGVHVGTEGTSSIYVRGGGPDQNLFLLDGVPVYNAAHLFGFFSVFNPDAIKTVQLYKGAFPARFGGRLSSVLDVSMKDGNMKELHGNISVGLISSKIQLEGPILKDKTSFMFSGRRSYLDLLAQPVLASQSNDNREISGLAYFHDINLKVNHILSENHRLFFSFYHGQDKGNGTEINNYPYDKAPKTGQSEKFFGVGWANTISSFRWNYLISPKLFCNTTLTYSKFFFDIESKSFERDLVSNTQNEESYRYNSGIEDLAGKIDFDYFPVSGHSLKFGAQYTHHYFSPGVSNTMEINEINPEQNENESNANREIYTNEISTYIEDNISISPKLKANIGIHFSAFNVDDTLFIRPQPRISLRYKVNDKLSFKGSYSRMAQHVHLLATTNVDMPSDLWVPVTKQIEPPVSDQLALGTAIDLKGGFNFTVETYYKNMNNIIAYKEGASFINGGNDWETKVEKGKGTSYGIEFLLEKTIGKTTGWIGYTLSKTTHQFKNINFGRPFPAKFDRRHDISVVVTHKFSDKFDISANWVYGTGNAVSLALSKVPINDIPYSSGWDKYAPFYPSRNNFRMPAYHRLDIGINFHKKKKHGVRTWNISIYNAYNQNNAFLFMWLENGDTATYDLTGDLQLIKVSLFPIIPSVSYSYKF
ncbi:MAG: TonB-dependent receptor [Prolixibacteraceae bacterium]|nr:TonB-dependent receptor [Prolixibacteraceae bacterium]